MHFRLVCILIILITITGCGQIMRDLQFMNVESGIFPMNMDMTLGNGAIDARELMESGTYEGVVENNGIKVYYPKGMRPKAERVAVALETAGIEVYERTGIPWAFDISLYLTPVSRSENGYRMRIPIRGKREMRFPLLIFKGEDDFISPIWARLVGHEIMEASMLAPLMRNNLVLGDYCLWGGGLVNETRWFREGVSEFAGDILCRHLLGEIYQPFPWIYDDLAKVRDGLLDWDNCIGRVGENTLYNASAGLIYELNNKHGDDVIARIMRAAADSRYINGNALRRAVKKVTNKNIDTFLKEYKTNWLGVDLRDSKRTFMLESPGNEVFITRIRPGSPAEKWKLAPGDKMMSVDKQPITSAWMFAHKIASYEDRDRLQVEIERSDNRFTYRMMVILKP